MRALRKAIESGDTNLVLLVMFHIYRIRPLQVGGAFLHICWLRLLQVGGALSHICQVRPLQVDGWQAA